MKATVCCGHCGGSVQDSGGACPTCGTGMRTSSSARGGSDDQEVAELLRSVSSPHRGKWILGGISCAAVALVAVLLSGPRHGAPPAAKHAAPAQHTTAVAVAAPAPPAPRAPAVEPAVAKPAAPTPEPEAAVGKKKHHHRASRGSRAAGAMAASR